MKKVTPYLRSTSAIAALDNGGRFYNLFTNAQDNEITSAELSVTAGVFGDRQKMFLFLDMALHDLDADEQQAVRELLSPELRAAYAEHAPQRLSPSDAESIGIVAKTAILTGYPRFVEDKTQFSGFIMIPIMAGKTMTFMMVPIMDRYDIYELRDEKSSQSTFIANVRGAKRLPEELHRFGGLLKQTRADQAGKKEGTLFLEAAYYTPLFVGD